MIYEEYVKGALLVICGFIIAYCFAVTGMMYQDRKNQRWGKVECIKATGQFNQCSQVFDR